MVPEIRKKFNAFFSEEKYSAYLADLHSAFPGDIEFRVAETPVFLDKAFTAQVLEACEDIVDVILEPEFRAKTDAAIPDRYRIPGDEGKCDFIAFDFGICEDGRGGYMPQLIEMQGFPSLFAYQVLQSEVTARHFPIPENYSPYLNGYNKESYIRLLSEIILNGHKPEEVILLEIYPEKQKTRIDFSCTRALVGIETVCLTALKADGRRLYYLKIDGSRQYIRRIYNRIIFDDLDQFTLPEGTIRLQDDWDISWCPHPHWFYRVSKFTLPFIKSRFVPETRFLHQVEELPADLENYVLKPLFSFAGQGVIIDLTRSDVEAVKDPANWILQKKVTYAGVIETPDIPAKAEIRIFYFWPTGAQRPLAVQNLARLSKGKMIGVRYNADKTWVGGSQVFFEQ